MTERQAEAALNMFLMRELDELSNFRQFMEKLAAEARADLSKAPQFLEDLRTTVAEWRAHMEKDHDLVFHHPTYQQRFDDFAVYISQRIKEFQKRAAFYEVQISKHPVLAEFRSAIAEAESEEVAKRWMLNNRHRFPSELRDKVLVLFP
ncbi:MAG TPA: hypothetical protein VGG72_21300 [Bryobacteraceae bacterium]|jgi:hypothetical protein